MLEATTSNIALLEEDSRRGGGGGEPGSTSASLELALEDGLIQILEGGILTLPLVPSGQINLPVPFREPLSRD